MPEGDTVWRTAHRLHRALSGTEVTVCDLRFPAVATVDLRLAGAREDPITKLRPYVEPTLIIAPWM